MKLYQYIARNLETWVESDHTGHSEAARERAKKAVKELMPSGSGIDNGTKLNLVKSTGDKLVFDVGFHHMNDAGYYIRWTHHQVVVKPSLAHEFDLKLTGRDFNGIKEYLGDIYHEALAQEVSSDTIAKWYAKSTSGSSHFQEKQNEQPD